MSKVNLTTSQDGIPRYTAQVEFRIGRSTLVCGLMDYLDRKVEVTRDGVDLNEVQVVLNLVRKQDVKDATKNMLQDGGYNGAESAGSGFGSGSTWDEVYTMAHDKVDELFPEFQ